MSGIKSLWTSLVKELEKSGSTGTVCFPLGPTTSPIMWRCFCKTPHHLLALSGQAAAVLIYVFIHLCEILAPNMFPTSRPWGLLGAQRTTQHPAAATSWMRACRPCNRTIIVVYIASIYCQLGARRRGGAGLATATVAIALAAVSKFPLRKLQTRSDRRAGARRWPLFQRD